MNKKLKILTTLAKQLISIMAFSITFFFGILAIVVNNQKIENMKLESPSLFYKDNLSNRNISIPDFEFHNSEEAPKTIYMLDTVKDLTEKNYQEHEREIKALQFGLKNLKVDQGFIDTFIDNQVAAFASQTIDDLSPSSPMYDLIMNGIKFFQDPKKMTENFNNINGFKSTNEKLHIFQPTMILDVNQAGQVGPGEEVGDDVVVTNQYVDQLEYLVAEVALDDLANEDAKLIFNIKDLTSADKDQHDYKLIIENDSNSLINLVEDSNPGQVINNLLTSGDIMVRDMLDVYDQEKPDLPLNTLSFLSLDYNVRLVDDGTGGQAEKSFIDIFIKPSSKNVGIDSAITFEAATDPTKNLAKTGFLDTSISPSHLSKNYKPSGIVPPFKGDDYMKNIKMYRGITNQKDQREITFWLGEGEAISLNLYYDGQEEAFKGDGKNALSLEFDGQIVEPNTKTMELKPGVSDPAGSNLSYEYVLFNVNIGTKKQKYARVKVVVDGTKITINNGKDITLPGYGDQHIFWDQPGYNQVLVATTTKGRGNVQFSVASDVTEKYLQYLGYAYANLFDNFVEPTTEVEGQTNPWYLASPEEDLLFGKYRYYDFNYTFYYESSQGGLEGPFNKNTILNYDYDFEEAAANKKLFVHDQDKGNYLVADDIPMLQDTSAKNVSRLLIDYANRNDDWLVNKLEVSDISKGQDYYLPKSAANMGGWVVSNLLANANQIKDDVLNHINALITLAYQSYDQLTNQEKQYIEQLDKANIFGPDFSIKENIESKIALAKRPDGSIDWYSEEYGEEAMAANSLIIRIVEGYLVEVVETILANENQVFEEAFFSMLGNSMKLYLENEQSGLAGIANQSLQFVNNENLSEHFKDSGVIALANSPLKSVNNGVEQLSSLLDFIYAFDLQQRYLSSANATLFNQYYEEGLLVKPESYIDFEKRNQIRQMIKIVDEIMKNIGLSAEDLSLTTILNKMIKVEIKDEEASALLGKTLNTLIEKITSNNTTDYVYQALNMKENSTYIENLIIGKNLTILVQKWIELNDDKIDDITKNQLLNLGLYDPDAITNFAIALGYYNLDYFLSSLTDASLIPEILDDLLKEDLTHSIAFDIPQSNAFVDWFSSPKSIMQVSLFTLGGLMSLIGTMIILLAFKKGLFTYMSKKSLVTARIVAITALGIGIAMILVGFVVTLI